jgi:hypothetical protein
LITIEKAHKMSDLDNSELIANTEALAFDNIAQRMANPKLLALRAQHPFIPILPFPNESRSVLLAANVAQDINLPTGTKMIMFSGNGEYYVSRKGNAQTPDGTSNTNDNGSLMNPEFCFWYVEEINQFSVIAPAACRVTVHCFIQP